MGRFTEWRERCAERAKHIGTYERLQKKNERWWVTALRALFVGLMLLPLKTDWFSTTKLIVSTASGVCIIAMTVITELHLAPLTRWRRLSAASGSISAVLVLMPAYLLLFDGSGNRENMWRLLCCAPFGWLLFLYCRLRVRRIRRESAEAIERIRRAQHRRKRLEMQ